MRKVRGTLAMTIGCLATVACQSPAARNGASTTVETAVSTGTEPSASTGPSGAPLAWEKGHPERAAWSNELRSEFRKTVGSFEAAKDMPGFCPRYSQLSSEQKVDVLATFAVAVAKFESAYDPKQHYGEPPPLGYDSIGLFQLSYEDGFSWCNMDRQSKSLEDPLTNIRCAVPEMAQLAAKDSVIAGGSTSRDARGLARYWSVVREGSSHHLTEIKAVTRALAVCG